MGNYSCLLHNHLCSLRTPPILKRICREGTQRPTLQRPSPHRDRGARLIMGARLRSISAITLRRLINDRAVLAHSVSPHSADTTRSARRSADQGLRFRKRVLTVKTSPEFSSRRADRSDRRSRSGRSGNNYSRRDLGADPPLVPARALLCPDLRLCYWCSPWRMRTRLTRPRLCARTMTRRPFLKCYLACGSRSATRAASSAFPTRRCSRASIARATTDLASLHGPCAISAGSALAIDSMVRTRTRTRRALPYSARQFSKWRATARASSW